MTIKVVDIRILTDNEADARKAIVALREAIGSARIAIKHPYRGRRGEYLARGTFQFDDGDTPVHTPLPDPPPATTGPTTRLAEIGPTTRLTETGPTTRLAETGPTTPLAETGPTKRLRAPRKRG